jgi:hypothetical protein
MGRHVPNGRDVWSVGIGAARIVLSQNCPVKYLGCQSGAFVLERLGLDEGLLLWKHRHSRLP